MSEKIKTIRIVGLAAVIALGICALDEAVGGFWRFILKPAKEPSYTHTMAFVKSHGFLSERSNGMWYYAEAIMLFRDKGVALDSATLRQGFEAVKNDPGPVCDLFLRGARAQHLGIERPVKEVQRLSSGTEFPIYDSNWIVTPYGEISHTELTGLAAVVALIAGHYVKIGEIEKAIELDTAIVAVGIQSLRQDPILSFYFIDVGVRSLERINAKRPEPTMTEIIQRIKEEKSESVFDKL